MTTLEIALTVLGATTALGIWILGAAWIVASPLRDIARELRELNEARREGVG